MLSETEIENQTKVFTFNCETFSSLDDETLKVLRMVMNAPPISGDYIVCYNDYYTLIGRIHSKDVFILFISKLKFRTCEKSSFCKLKTIEKLESTKFNIYVDTSPCIDFSNKLYKRGYNRIDRQGVVYTRNINNKLHVYSGIKGLLDAICEKRFDIVSEISERKITSTQDALTYLKSVVPDKNYPLYDTTTHKGIKGLIDAICEENLMVVDEMLYTQVTSIKSALIRMRNIIV